VYFSSVLFNFIYIMQLTPFVTFSVVVVTTGIYNKETDIWLKRGITCSSFTSVALKPPIISFAIHMPR